MNAPTTFRDAYETLRRHAETLRNQREPDLDNLLTIVTESVGAYQVCKARIDAVEKALEEALGGAGLDGGGQADAAPQSPARPAPRPQVPPADLDDDTIPF